jgi:spermidine/putrescine-binding protein
MTQRAMMTRRRALSLGAGGALAAPFVVRAASAQGKTVYVNSYGSVWETAWKKAFFEPFTAQTGIEVKTVPGVVFAKLKAQAQTGNYEFDQVNLGDSEFAQALTPAWPDNEKVMFVHDTAWLAPRLAQIRERWTQWMTA